MRQMYLPATAKPTKKDYVNLIRHCGWGMPDLDRALWSAGNSLTLVVEDLVHPYGKDDKRGVVSRDMNLHALPWPKEEWEALGDAEVQLHVTLSYFIEPNPSARGVSSRAVRPSCEIQPRRVDPHRADRSELVRRHRQQGCHRGLKLWRATP